MFSSNSFLEIIILQWRLFWKKQVWRQEPILSPKHAVFLFNMYNGKNPISLWVKKQQIFTATT